MKIEISKLFGRGLLVAVLSLGMVSGIAYQGTAFAGGKGATASGLGAGNASGMAKEKSNNKSAVQRWVGCCGGPAAGDDGSDSGDGGGGDGYDDGSADPGAF